MSALLSNTSNDGGSDLAIHCGGNFLELSIVKGQTQLQRNGLQDNLRYGTIWLEIKMRLRNRVSILELVHSGGIIGWVLNLWLITLLIASDSTTSMCLAY